MAILTTLGAIGFYQVLQKIKGPLVKPVSVYHYEISGLIDIAAAERFKKFISQRKAGDRVLIHIESQGGLVVSMNKIIFYLAKTRADVACYVDSHAFSAAANILTYCKRMVVTPRALVMFHLSQICTERGLLGGCNKQKAVSPTFRPEVYKRAFRDFKRIRVLFTEQEYHDLINGKDIEIEGVEFMNRLRKAARNAKKK